MPSCRSAGILCGVSLALLGSPARSYAILDWLCPWSPRGQQTVATTYAPPFSGRVLAAAPRYSAAPLVPAVAAQPTTYYVARIAYRTVYRPVAVTSCMPVQGYDPCTGCPVISYRPVTTWAYQAQLVPYTTYQLVSTRPVYAPAWTVSPGVVSGAAAASGCATCGTAAGPSTTISPTPMPQSALPAPGTVVPLLPPSGSGSLVPSAPGPLGSTPQPALPSGASSTRGLAPSGGTALPAGSPWGTQPSGSSSSPSGTSPGGGSGSSGFQPAAPSGQSPKGGGTSGSNSWPASSPRPSSATAPQRAPVLNAPADREAERLLRQASFSRPVEAISNQTVRVTIRLDASGWEAVR